MAYDPAKVYYITSDTIDKILYESPTTSNTYSGGGGPASPVTHNYSEAHTIGQSVIANGMFSINGSDFYPCGSPITGSESGISVGLTQFLDCDLYADASNIYVYIRNGFDAAQTVYIYYALEALS